MGQQLDSRDTPTLVSTGDLPRGSGAPENQPGRQDPGAAFSSRCMGIRSSLRPVQMEYASASGPHLKHRQVGPAEDASEPVGAQV